MRLLGAAVVSVLVLSIAAGAQAGPRGQWTRLPGTVINFAEPGLARTGDGVLHVIYTRRSTATAPAAGMPWTLKPADVVQAPSAYATGVAGAGLAKDGTPISTWSVSPGLGYHYGINGGDPDRAIPQSGCCLYTPEIAVDSASGQAWVGFHSNENAGPGLFVNAIGPGGPQGGRKLAQGSVVGKSSIYPGNRTSLTGRIGAGGVYLFYGQGYPTFKTLALWKVDTARPGLVIKADRNEHANVAAAPEGRLWLMWEQNGVINAARTNRAATRVGAVNAIRPPSGAAIFRLNGEGSAGPLDLVANMQVAGGQ